MKKILDKSSVTGVDTGFKAEDLDKKDLIAKLHHNVTEYIKKIRPDINHWKLKNNTGNGGIKIWYNDSNYFDVTFTPSINQKNQIALRLSMNFGVPRPERMTGLSFNEIMQDPILSKALASLDSIIKPMLENTDYFNGRMYEGYDSYFPSYSEELKYLHDKGHMSADIFDNPQFWIDLAKPSLFEEKEIVASIGNMLIANYDFRKEMENFK